MNLTDKSRSIRQKLSNLSREKKISYQYVETSFLLERLVARITSDKKLYEAIVFKGGYVGLRVYQSSRYTIDLDALLTKFRFRDVLQKIRKTAEIDINDAV